MADHASLPARSDRRALVTDLDARRRELRLATDELRDAAVRWVQPREYVRARPYRWVVGAALVGLVLGARRRPPR